MSEINQTPLTLASKMLAGMNCKADLLGKDLVISLEGENVEESSLNETTKTLSSALLDEAMKRPITLTMHQTPLPFVTQMLQGMSGVTIQLPEQHRSFFYTPQPQIDVQAHQTPLAEVLRSIAEQIDAEVVVRSGAVLLQSNQPAVN